MRFREHRGGLRESIATTIEIEPTIDALLIVVRNALEPYGAHINEKQIHVSPYGFDGRIGWDTHIVTVDGYGLFGFSDAAIKTA